VAEADYLSAGDSIAGSISERFEHTGKGQMITFKIDSMTVKPEWSDEEAMENLAELLIEGLDTLKHTYIRSRRTSANFKK
jgi:hypothetical protein